MFYTLFNYKYIKGLYNNLHVLKIIATVTYFVAVDKHRLILCLIKLLLVMANDVERNPGPQNSQKVKKLRICHSNVRSLSRAKLLAIKTTLSGAFDIITLSETHLSNNVTNDVFSLKGYHDIIRKDRDGAGGGVAVYIKDDIYFKRMANYEKQNIEAIWFQIKSKSGKFMICCVYRPPTNFEFWDDFSEVLDEVKINYTSNIIIIGDLNADFKTHNGIKMLSMCRLYNMEHLINDPTRITTTSATVLDQALTGSPAFIEKVEIQPPLSTSDHCTIALELKFDLPKEKPYERHIWQFDKGNFEGFRDALRIADFDSCFDTECIDEACKNWTDTFLTVARTNVPNKVVLIRPKDSPWYSNELRLSKRKLTRLFHKFKKRATEESWEVYKKARNEYQKMLTDAEKNYHDALCQSLGTARNARKWWTTVKHVLGKGNDTTYPSLEDGQNIIHDNCEKSELMNNFFLSHSHIDTSNATIPENDNEDLCENTITNVLATEKDVGDLLRAINVNKATGHDGVSPKLLKEAGAAIVPSLTKLINMSLMKSKVPSMWKKANVLPLFKKGSKNNVNNYRPVSLLCLPSKILEQIVFKKVYNHIRDNNLLTEHQSGFQSGDSTVHQLSYLYHEFCKALDEKKEVRIVFCDISKAFDKVWHEGLIFKLKRMGISGSLLEWFKDYLSNRLQRVIIRGQHSLWGLIKAGVPQGSVLGPLLFLIYINDIADNLTCKIKLFADDTTLYLTFDDQDIVKANLEENLNRISEWANQWIVSFSPTKTKSMTVSFKNKKSKPITFNNSELEEVSEYKHLGLTFSSTLSWNTHIQNLVGDVAKMSNVLKRLKYSLDRKTLETIYTAFIRPKLEYASHIWDNCSKKDADLLESFQLDVARTVTGARKGTSHNLLYVETGWQTLSTRRKNSKLSNFHRIVHGTAPEYLSSLLPENRDAMYNLRNPSNYTVPKARTQTYKSSFIPDTILLWNSLPAATKEIEDIDMFKKQIIEKKPDRSLYQIGQRRTNIKHAQLRMNCSKLNFHLYLLHVVESPSCICGSASEDPYHFFYLCPLYAIQRAILFQNLSMIHDRINVQTLLFGDETLSFETNKLIFETVHSFIELCGRLD